MIPLSLIFSIGYFEVCYCLNLIHIFHHSKGNSNYFPWPMHSSMIWPLPTLTPLLILCSLLFLLLCPLCTFSFNSKPYSQLGHLYLFLSQELCFHWIMRLDYFHLSTSSWNHSSCIGPTLSKETHPFKLLYVSYILFISFLALIIILCFLWTD